MLLDCSMGLCVGGLSCQYIEPKLSNLTIKIDDLYFDIMPHAFLINATDLGVEPEFENKCIFGVIPLPEIVGDSLMFLLGDVFLRNYYSVFDYDNQLVYLAVNSHAKDHANITRPAHTHVFYGTYLFALLISYIIFRSGHGRINREMSVRLHNMQAKLLRSDLQANNISVGDDEQTSEKGSIGDACSPQKKGMGSKSVGGDVDEPGRRADSLAGNEYDRLSGPDLNPGSHPKTKDILKL
jgi:hypothetical protein